MPRTRDDPNASPRDARRFATRRRRDREIEIRVLYCEKEKGKEKPLTKIGDGDEIARTKNRAKKSLMVVAGEEFIPAIDSGNDRLTLVNVASREEKGKLRKTMSV